MFEQFTQDARQTVVLAQSAARRLGHHYIGTEHLLLGLLSQPHTLAARLLVVRGLDLAYAETTVLRLLGTPGLDARDADALGTIGIDLSAIKEKVEATFGRGALDRDPAHTRAGRFAGGGHIPFTKRAKKVLELSLREALRLKHKHIADGHLLLGLLREGEGLAAKVLAEAGIDFAQLRADLDRDIPAVPA
ncbi:Clp protease [Solihabitans fulvus]|uniref:Clp protease n=1 Tax=Solihabitans fulvus TaxID=1892852 RepID=A0A5B2XUI9_9PSEU|nr:Clp protease N-terminal domain-containing protein [Solihabitans fulvus]KAA2266592.1 Clp protease [Solihabitans fulvus]